MTGDGREQLSLAAGQLGIGEQTSNAAIWSHGGLGNVYWRRQYEPFVGRHPLWQCSFGLPSYAEFDFAR